MLIDLYAIHIELDAPLFYISITFPKAKDLMLVCTVRPAPMSPFSVQTQPPPFSKVVSISKPILLLCILDMCYSWIINLLKIVMCFESAPEMGSACMCTCLAWVQVFMMDFCIIVHCTNNPLFFL